MKEKRKVRLWIVNETDKAYRVSTLPKGDKDGRIVWIPKSQLFHISKDPFNKDKEWQPCTITMESWIADKLDL